MKEAIKIAYVGCGRRGRNVMKKCFSMMSDVDVVALCDIQAENLEKTKEIIVNNGKPVPPIMTSDYDKILKNPEIDAVILMTGWDDRTAMAKKAMLAGKYTAVEVGCCETLEECFDLIDTYEKTGVPLMMLENCCYDRRELMTLNMREKGLFGEIVHCTGAYAHYLPKEELFHELYNDPNATEVTHYRLAHYINSNRESYPTHELGPISKILNLNRGNRMVSLVSVASKAAGLKQHAKDHFGEDSKYANIDYKQGDIFTTLITCANGETIRLTLDTTLPRPYYSRDYGVRGTKGLYMEERKTIFLDGMEEIKEVVSNEKEYFEKYDHPLQREFQSLKEKRGGHGGMDYLVCRAFVESVKRGTNTPIDAYDTVLWMSIGALSEESIKTGRIVEVPDFTNGKWAHREPPVLGKYCLDVVCDDPETPIY